MTNPCCTWDFTASADKNNKNDIEKLLKEISKKYCFQKEFSDSGYEHFQGRISLKLKNRITGLKKMVPKDWHLSITSNENKNNQFYVMKEDTRIDGPWKDTDEVIYIPRQIKEIKTLYPWQQYIVDNYDVWDTRTINIIVDNKGNCGKSILAGYVRAYKLGFVIPFCNDFRDIMRMIMDVPTKRLYLIDMPRAINKEKLYQMYSALETIKNGYAYDDRYSFKEKVFDCPNIWVFTNNIPDISYLSTDRWKFWNIDELTLMLNEGI